MKLRLRDMEAVDDNVESKDPLDLVDVYADVGDNEDEIDQFFQWINPSHLDEDEGNPNLDISIHVADVGIDVNMLMAEEVRFNGESVREKISTGETTGGGSSNAGDDTDFPSNYVGDDFHTPPGFDRYNYAPMSPFNGEDDFTHTTQDYDHGSRKANKVIGGVGKRGRKSHDRRMSSTSQQKVDSISTSMDNMSITTDSNNEAWSVYHSHQIDGY